MIDEVFAAFTIYLIIPILSLSFLFLLIRKMKKSKVSKPPILNCILITLNYTLLIIAHLTALIWAWTGIAAVLFIYLLTVAPITKAWIIYNYYQTEVKSKYDKCLLYLSVIYLCLLPLYLYFTFSKS